MLRRVCLLLPIAACAPKAPVAAPSPTRITSTRSPADAVQAAAQVLTTAGFEIATSDAAAGVLTARRTRASTGNDEYVRCRGAKGSVLETNRSSTLTVAVIASAAGGGSTATINTTVATTYPSLQGTATALPPSDTDCVSKGTIEQRVAAALGG